MFREVDTDLNILEELKWQKKIWMIFQWVRKRKLFKSKCIRNSKQSSNMIKLKTKNITAKVVNHIITKIKNTTIMTSQQDLTMDSVNLIPWAMEIYQLARAIPIHNQRKKRKINLRMTRNQVSLISTLKETTKDNRKVKLANHNKTTTEVPKVSKVETSLIY